MIQLVIRFMQFAHIDQPLKREYTYLHQNRKILDMDLGIVVEYMLVDLDIRY